VGAPGISPAFYFRMFFTGYFESMDWKGGRRSLWPFQKLPAFTRDEIYEQIGYYLDVSI